MEGEGKGGRKNEVLEDQGKCKRGGYKIKGHNIALKDRETSRGV